jgi:hypothetical protein
LLGPLSRHVGSVEKTADPVVSEDFPVKNIHLTGNGTLSANFLKDSLGHRFSFLLR